MRVRHQKTESRNCETHDGTAAEGDGKGGGYTTGTGGFSGPRVGRRGNPHSDEAGKSGQDCPEHVGNGSPRSAPVEQDANQDRHHNHKDRDPRVLPFQEGHGAFADCGRQLDHALVALRGSQHDAGVIHGQDKGQSTRDERDIQNRVRHLSSSSTKRFREIGAARSIETGRSPTRIPSSIANLRLSVPYLGLSASRTRITDSPRGQRRPHPTT